MSFAVQVSCSPDQWDEILAGWSEDYPIQGVVEDPAGYRVFFASRATAEKFAQAQNAVVEEIADQAWTWWEDWQPLEIGRRFFLCPPWLDTPTPQGRIRLAMVGTNVFGGGEHPTTQLCLELLEDAITPASRVLDVGTGTGILAAAARGLGAAQVWACDVEPEAARLASEHALVWQGSADAARAGLADLIVSNIHLAVLREVLPDIRRLAAPVILSGFLPSQINEVTNGIQVHRLLERDGWCALWGSWNVS